MSNNILHSHDVFFRDKISFKWQQAYAEVSFKLRPCQRRETTLLSDSPWPTEAHCATRVPSMLLMGSAPPTWNQVLIRGGRTRKQIIYVDAPAPENGVRQEQEVGMKEVTERSSTSLSGLGTLHVMKS